jgi:hypothetical protein
MPWTREDSRYLVALLTALAAVVYLVAANFGLVPSPIPEVNVRPANQVVGVPAATTPEATPSPTPLSSGVVVKPSARPGPGRPTPTPKGSPGPSTPPPSHVPTPSPTPSMLPSTPPLCFMSTCL